MSGGLKELVWARADDVLEADASLQLVRADQGVRALHRVQAEDPRDRLERVVRA